MFQSADVKIMESINQLVRDNVDVLTTSRTVEEGMFVVHMFIVYCLPFIVYCLYHMSQLSSMCKHIKILLSSCWQICSVFVSNPRN